MSRRNRLPKSTEKYLERATKTEWNTAIYSRLSDENNGFEDDRSLQNQIKYLEAYIKKLPELMLVDTYVDNGQSGLDFDRAEFRRMLEDVRNGRINCIVVKDLSRFGRNHIEAGYYLEKIFPQLDIRFISVNDGYDSKDDAEADGLILPLKNMLNEMYARETQRKVLATLRAKEKAKEHPFSAVPYGYVVDPDCNYHLLPDRNTSGYVRLIFKMKSEGKGLTAIADYLNLIGAPTPLDYRKSQGKYISVPSAGKWDYISVQNLLGNRTYTGATVYNTTGKGEYTVIPNTHEALVDEDVFEAVLKEMSEKGSRKSEALKKGRLRAEKFPNILKGIFFCGNCGYAMLYDRTGNTDILRNFRYRCGNYNNYRKNDHDAPPCAVKISGVPEQAVYKFILDEIRKQLKAGVELKKELFSDDIPIDTTGIIRLSDTSTIEIICADNPDMVERLLRKGLTRELLSATVDRLWYSADGSFSIRFKPDFSSETGKGE